MTIKEIADLATSGETTIRRWAEKASAKMADISAKMAKARETSVAAEFTLPETIAIIRAGGNDTLADLLEMNAKQEQAKPMAQPKKLPNGKQMEIVLESFKAGAITALELRIAFLMAPAQTQPAPQPTVIYRENPVREQKYLTSSEIESGLAGIVEKVTAKGAAVAKAVAYKEMAKEQGKAIQEKLNGKLDFSLQEEVKS